MTGKLVLVALVAVALHGADKIRLGLFTAMPVKWDLEANWRTFAESVEMHAREKPDLIVTPECFLDGYVASAKDWTLERFEKIAQVRDSSPYIAKVRELAKRHGTAILFGYTEKKNGNFYNAALLVDSSGAFVGEYYKTHLQNHDLRFSPGESLPVFDTPWGKAGVLICADRRWPETARVLRLKGARIILIPSYGMWGQDNEWWMKTRSYENENFLAFAHPNVAFVTTPAGQVLAKLQTNMPGMLVCDVDLSEVSDKRHIRDRRPELYGEIAQPK